MPRCKQRQSTPNATTRRDIDLFTKRLTHSTQPLIGIAIVSFQTILMLLDALCSLSNIMIWQRTRFLALNSYFPTSVTSTLTRHPSTILRPRTHSYQLNLHASLPNIRVRAGCSPSPPPSLALSILPRGNRPLIHSSLRFHGHTMPTGVIRLQ